MALILTVLISFLVKFIAAADNGKQCSVPIELLPKDDLQQLMENEKKMQMNLTYVNYCHKGVPLNGKTCTIEANDCPVGYHCELERPEADYSCCPDAATTLWQPKDKSRSREDYLISNGMKKTHLLYVAHKIPQLKTLIAKKFGKSIVDQKLLTLLFDDIVLMPDQVHFLSKYYAQILDDKQRSKRKIRNFDNFPVNKWEMPILYKIDNNFDNDGENQILAAILHWEQHTCIRFERLPLEQEIEQSHILYTNFSRGCSSAVGKSTFTIPQLIKLGGSCTLNLGTIVHEIGHTIGFQHEHVRPDRDSYVQILEENVLAAELGNFIIESEDRVNIHNVPYDYGSVMHYGTNFFSENHTNLDTISAVDSLYDRSMGQRTGLSFYDIKLANLAFCNDSCPEPLPCERGGITDPNDCSKCICPDGFGGALCDQVPPSDSRCLPMRNAPINVDSVDKQCLESPSYGHDSYEANSQCNWHLRAEPGQRIDVYFDDNFKVYCRNQSCYHWVEVKYKNDTEKPGPRFCCYEKPDPVLTSEGNEVVISFRSNYESEVTTPYTREGFKLCYKLYNEKRECESNPCENSGTCQDVGDRYVCTCRHRFTGKHCEYEMPVDFCEDDPCRNGGTCHNMAMGYSCDCSHGYTGRNCEIPVDFCAPNPCQNSGICEVVVGYGYVCHCPQTHQGHLCETQKGPCEEGWTLHSGSCYKYRHCAGCSLPWGEASNACDNVGASLASIETDEEQTWIAQWLNKAYNAGRVGETPHTQMWIGGVYSEGVWRWMKDGQSISCDRPHWRNRCDSSLGPCLSFSTSHLFYGKWQSYICDYSRPYLCEKSADISDGEAAGPCDSGPCLNGGECIETGDDQYECSCSSLFTGNNCETGECPFGWVKYEKHCYLFNQNVLSWEDSSTACIQQGAHLVVIETDSEQKWIREWLTNDYDCGVFGRTPQTQMWIGGTYTNYKWNWYIHNNRIGCHRPHWGYRGCQSTTAGTCLAFSLSHLYYAKWFDYPCEYERAYLCEFPLQQEEIDQLPDLTDECYNSPCENGGTCTDLGSAYACECTESWHGDNCEVKGIVVDVCADEPCQHGGKCQQEGYSNYTCDCTGSYTGNKCEKEWKRPKSSTSCYIFGDKFASFEDASQMCQSLGGTLASINDKDEKENLRIMSWLQHDCGAGLYGKSPHTWMWIGGKFTNPQFKWISTGEYIRCDSQNWGTRGCKSAKKGQCLASSISYSYYGKWFEENCDNALPYLCQKDNSDEGSCTEVGVDIGGDHCAGSPCGPRGTCIATQISYVCKCAGGWGGLKCDVDMVDDCHQVICENGGSCIDGEDFYYCKCTEDYGGRHCEVRIKDLLGEPCVDNPCKNGGSCQVKGNQVFCECSSDWTGSYCENELVDKCKNIICENNGTCIDGFCKCQSGWRGNNCEIAEQYDKCKDIVCQNKGKCTYGSCECMEGWTGSYCENKIKDKCEGILCENGGSCMDGTCKCLLGWSGTKCEVDVIDNCHGISCQNGGTCIDGVNSFNCNCPKGFGGIYCENDIADNCKGISCMNGGTCVDGINSFECKCPKGFGGTYCENDIDDSCWGITCKNGGTCVDGINSFECKCPKGFGGTYCENDIDDSCQGITCKNGGTCVDGVSLFKCKCPKGFGGTYCEIDIINNCEGISCKNGGKCVDGVNSFSCKCPQGFSGTYCENDIVDNCEGRTCKNGGTCVDGINSFECKCPKGFGGTYCENDIFDNCEGISCKNGGTCVDGTNSFECKCPKGFGGTYCEIDIINNCEGISCKNGGKCVDGVNSFSCKCPQGFSGTYCENDIVDNCEGITCRNGGTCVDGINSFECKCPKGFGGTYCENDIFDNCEGITCKNGGTCVDGINSFECKCPKGFGGTYCENDIFDNCEGITCKNGGTCVDGIHSFECKCPKGFGGTYCENDIFDNCEGITCKNGGTCVDGVNSFECKCPKGFGGTYCENDIFDNCEGITCKNGGTCVDGINSFECKCPKGFGGTYCENDIFDNCEGITCKNGGTCVDGINSFECKCPKGVGGNYCENDIINNCEGISCKNGGTCVDGINSFECKCPKGFGGKYCESDIFDNCEGTTCKNGGTCVDGVNSFECKCPKGFGGTNCENDIDDSCQGVTCKNGGTCVDGINSFECKCPKGFGGTYCENDIFDNCEGITCKNGGTCVDGINSFVCKCPKGFGGNYCENDIFDNCEGITCKNGGTCVDGINSFECKCPKGFGGTYCENDIINNCEGISCKNGGTCVDGINSFECKCPKVFGGTYCESDIFDNCESITCENGGTCVDGINSFECKCPKGFGGTYCENDINDSCQGITCKNGGTCVDGINSFECKCQKGFGGTYCENDIFNNCESITCKNGGTCVDGINSFECKCPKGFGGTYCENDIDDSCQGVTCKNGGTCVDGINSFECKCPTGFGGTYCERDIFDNCEGITCKNGGTCVDDVKSFSCKCPQGFGGTYCERDIIDNCQGSICKNGGTCYDGINSFECKCPTGFRGTYCENDILDDCKGHECKNGATCIDGINTYKCLCAKGWTGSKCETDLTDNCANQPCKNGGVCKDIGTTFSCGCSAPYTGKYCEIIWSRPPKGASCYAFVNISHTFKEATTTCNDLGGYLASNEGTGGDLEHTWIAGWLQREYNTGISGKTPHTQMWIGGQYSAGTYKWIPSGLPIDCKSQHWRSPSCATTVGTCLAYSISHIDYAKWLNYNCDADRPFLCKKKYEPITSSSSTSRLSSADTTQDSCKEITGIDVTDECSTSPCNNGGTCVDIGEGYTCKCSQGWTGMNCDIRVVWKQRPTLNACYSFINKNANFTEAQNICKSVGATLSDVVNTEENKWIAEWLQTDYKAGIFGGTPHTQMWIGGRFSKISFGWITSGREIDCKSPNWGSRGCQSSSVGECLSFSVSHINYAQWFDYSCTSERPFLCKMTASECPGTLLTKG